MLQWSLDPWTATRMMCLAVKKYFDVYIAAGSSICTREDKEVKTEVAASNALTTTSPAHALASH
jgi:hypothetical protein